jgi:hypothetical protein
LTSEKAYFFTDIGHVKAVKLLLELKLKLTEYTAKFLTVSPELEPNSNMLVYCAWLYSIQFIPNNSERISTA